MSPTIMPAAGPAEEPLPPLPPLPSLHILLAEDNALSAEYGALLLARAGHRVQLASDGLQALALCARQRFDLILMDIEMPNMGGLAATEAIRALEVRPDHQLPGTAATISDGARDDAATVIIALSAHMQEDDRRACLAAGMDGYLVKPIDVAAVHLALAQINAQRS